MKMACFIFFQVILLPLLAAESPVPMDAFRVVPSQMYFHISLNTQGEINGITVIQVKSGSPADRLGIREGDRLTMENGGPVIGLSRSDITAPNGGVALHGEVRFEGHRGIFRKKWSITFDAKQLRQTPNQTSGPAVTGDRVSP